MRAVQMRPVLQAVLDVHPSLALIRYFTGHRSAFTSSVTVEAAGSRASQRSSWHRPAKARKLCTAAVQSPTLENGLQYTNAIPLPTGEVHLWWLEADEVYSGKLLDQYYKMLPDSEKQYVREGANDRVRKERLLARTLVRAVLIRYCKDDTPFKELEFECSPSGKPWLVSEQGKDGKGDQLHFNLTHTDRLLGVAVSRGGLVGLDSENSSRLTKFNPVDLARRRFSPREFAVLTGFENLAEQQRLFIRLWCLKEAYIKATGRGIMAPPGLAAFTFELLLNIKTRPSRRRPNSQGQYHGLSNTREKTPQQDDSHSREQDPASQQPWKYSMDEESSGHRQSGFDRSGWEDRQGPEAVWGANSRAPFTLQFQPPVSDEASWEAWLMELCGGHTAALVIESGKKTDSAEAVEARPPVQLKCFKTVPTVSEEVMGSRYCRVIGYGHSAANT